MLVLQVVQVLRQTCPAPHELEILLLLFLTEGLKDPPEASYYGMIAAAVGE